MPDGIGPAGMKTAGRWPKVSAAISSPGTILSQMPRKTAASNMSCERPIAGGHRDRVAREERQLHARLALRDAVAHRRHAARDLRRRRPRARAASLDQLGEALIGLMRRQHVVVGGDDARGWARRRRGAPPCRSGPQAAKPWARLEQERRAPRCGFLRAAARDALEIVRRGRSRSACGCARSLRRCGRGASWQSPFRGFGQAAALPGTADTDLAVCKPDARSPAATGRI